MASQESDVSDVAMSDSQLDREAAALLAANPDDDRLADGLAKDAAELAAGLEQMKAAAAGEKGEEDDDELDDGYYDEGEEGQQMSQEQVDSLLSAGEAMLCASQSQSQESAVDDADYMEKEVEAEFKKFTTSLWMQKRVVSATAEMQSLVEQHEKSKKKLVEPVKDLMAEQPEREKSLKIVAGILSAACTDGALRAMVIDAADVLKKQEELVEKIGEKMTYIKVGQKCIEEKKAEEAAKAGVGGSAMDAAAALLASTGKSKAGASSGSKTKKPRK